MLSLRVDIVDVIAAYLLAIERAAGFGFGRYIFSATTPGARISWSSAKARQQWSGVFSSRSRKSVESIFGIANHLLPEVNHDFDLNGITDSQKPHDALNVPARLNSAFSKPPDFSRSGRGRWPRMLNHFDRQAALLLNIGYPEMMGVSEERFIEKLEPLRSRLKFSEPFERHGNIPLCIAFREGVVGIADAMSRIQARSTKGIVDMTPLSPEDFHVLDEVEIPSGEFYLMLDVDTGRDFLNVSPENALAAIRAQGRTPMTLAEGVALTAQFPELLTDKKNYNCIQMPGSRKKSDQRVPSIWFSKGAPRLGWCWDRNIHTWLGSVSAAYRLGATSAPKVDARAAPV